MSVASGGGTLQSGTEKIPAPSCADAGGSEGVFNRQSRGAESKEMGLPMERSWKVPCIVTSGTG